MTCDKGQSRGFPAIELMVTLVIVAVMATIAAPSVVEVIRPSRRPAAANQLQAARQIARREAIRRNTTVLMCPSTSGTCPASGLSGANWATGWVVCYDVNSPIDGCDTTVTTDPNP